MAVSAAEEGQHVVVQHRAYRRGEPGTDERYLLLLPHQVLQHGRQLPQLRDQLVVDLVEGEKQTGTVLHQEITGCSELGANGR